MQNNGKWQLAFWIVTVICSVWLVAVTQGVVANEIRNVSEHKDLRECVYSQFSEIQKELSGINSRLARIEAKMEIK
jgi:hypothetical protein